VKIGEAYFGRDDIEGGIQVYRRAIDEVPAADFRARMQARIARRYYESRRFEKALEEYAIYTQAYDGVSSRGGLGMDRARFQVAQCLFELGEARRAAGDAQGSRDYFLRAQTAYLEVAEQFPGTQLKAEGLFGAGLTAQLRGTEADLVQALELFARLRTDHPERVEYVQRADLQAARVAHAQRANARAAEAYGAYLRSYPEAPERPQALLELGVVYRDAGDMAKAIGALDRIPEGSAVWARAGLVAGELLLRQGSLDSAEVMLRRGLRALAPGEAGVDLVYVLGRTLFEQGRFAASAEAFTEVLGQAAGEGMLQGSLLGRGAAYYQLADYQRAVVDLEAVLADGGAPVSMKDQAHRLLGQAYVHMGRRAEAIKDYEAIIAATTDPQERAENLLLLAELYYGLGRYGETIERTSEVLASDFEDTPEERGYLLKERAYFVMGDAHTQLGDHAEARRVFAQAMATYPASALRPDLMFGEAVASFALEDYRRVIGLLEDFVASYPGNPNTENACYFLAYSYLRRTDFEQAASWFGRLATQFPQSEVASEALFQQGETLFHLARHRDAAAAYRGVLDTYPDSEFADNAMYSLGWGSFELGETGQALDYFRVLLERFPASEFAPAAQFTLGDHHFNEKNYEEASRAYGLVVEQYPESEMAADARDLLTELQEIQAYLKYEAAMSLFDAGDYGMAAASLREVIESYPQTPSVAGAMANLGMSYEFIHKWREAAGVYRELVDNYADQPESAPAVAFAKEHMTWILTNRL
ncbi:MAG: tetratricopeptide repeat protein, partial [bacterium]